MPVYVFIHGGVFSFGSGNYFVYNGTNLAKKDIVVVTINYRLNFFGFFGLPKTATKIDGHATNFN
jgi:carboxylesterase type B